MNDGELHMAVHAGNPFALYDDVELPVFAVEAGPEAPILHYSNGCFRRLAGIAGARSAGRPIHDLLPREMADAVERHGAESLGDGRARQFDAPVFRNGRDRWLRVTLTPGPPGGAAGPILLGGASDITDIKMLEIRNAEEIVHLSQANDDLVSFAGLVAHDMRTPLATVKMATVLALQGFQDLGDGKLSMIKMCERTVEKCLVSIDEVMAQVGGKDVADRRDTEIDIAEMCRTIAAIADPECRLRIELPEGRVRADKAILHLGIRNLLDNAVRYARSTVSIHVADDGRRDGLLSVAVVDNGAGLPDGFDLDRHVDPVRRADVGRGGFGLRAVARLVRSRGGDLSCASTPGGTMFRVSLPGSVLRA